MMNADCRMLKWGIIELNYIPRLPACLPQAGSLGLFPKYFDFLS
jgi:hypothetical protein